MLLQQLKKVPWTKNWFRSVEVAVFCAGCALLVPSFDWSSNFLCTMRKSAYMEWYRFVLCSLTICIGPLTSIGLLAHSSWPFGIGHPRPYWYTILKTYTLCGVKNYAYFTPLVCEITPFVILCLLRCKIMPSVLPDCLAVIMTISEYICFSFSLNAARLVLSCWGCDGMHSTTYRKVTGTQRWWEETRTWMAVLLHGGNYVQEGEKYWRQHCVEVAFSVYICMWFFNCTGLLALHQHLNGHAFADKPQQLSLRQCFEPTNCRMTWNPESRNFELGNGPHEFRRLLELLHNSEDINSA